MFLHKNILWVLIRIPSALRDSDEYPQHVFWGDSNAYQYPQRVLKVVRQATFS